MDKPDVVVELARDENGRVTKFEYKVHDAGTDDRRELEACALLHQMFVSEGPEDHSVRVDVHLGLGE